MSHAFPQLVPRSGEQWHARLQLSAHALPSLGRPETPATPSPLSCCDRSCSAAGARRRCSRALTSRRRALGDQISRAPSLALSKHARAQLEPRLRISALALCLRTVPPASRDVAAQKETPRKGHALRLRQVSVGMLLQLSHDREPRGDAVRDAVGAANVPRARARTPCGRASCNFIF